jgi:hypothetical protein
MIRKLFLILIFPVFFTGVGAAQAFISTTDLFKRSEDNSGQLNITQDPGIDSLICRYILMSRKIYDQKNDGSYGMSGWRIQIYNSSNRNAREESGKARAEFINKFPDIASYPMYSEPGYFKVRVGDFRTKTEATKLFLIISRVFPNAYIVPDIINFPDLEIK